MLEAILDSKVQTNLAAFFLSNAERGFSAYELQKIFGSAAERHLSALLRAGLLKSYFKKNIKYYILNYKNKELPEIKNKIIKAAKLTKKHQDLLVGAIRKMPKIKLAVLSGLFLGNPEMNCDLLLVGDITKRRLDDFIKLAEKMLCQEINFGLFKTEEFEMRKNMFDRFIKDIFENRHTVVINKLKF